MRVRQAILTVSAVVAAAGCATTPPALESRAPLPPPAAWQAAAPEATPDEPRNWLQDLGDVRLEALVAEALRTNPGFAAGLARVAAARARADVAGAAEWPGVNLGLTGQRSRRLVNDVALTTNSFGLSANVNWELDLWRRLDLRTLAAVADAEASEYDLAAARLALAADTAQAWFAAAEARLQAQLARQRVQSFRNTLEIIEERYRGGLSEALDVRLARENLATAEATVAVRERAFDAARRSLEVLLGRYPAGELEATATLGEPLGSVPAGLPSGLLERRPDIRAASQRALATQARAEDAARNRLPSFVLTGSGGTLSPRFRDLLDWDQLVWSLLGTLTQPLFQGGRLDAERALAQANDREALANYARVVLTAFKEVETALAAEPLYAEQTARQSAAAREANDAATLALEQYRAGLTDIITLLDTQRRAFNAESALLEARLRRLQNRIELYRALGGDFSATTAAAGAQP